jgi:hypothetical protein
VHKSDRSSPFASVVKWFNSTVHNLAKLLFIRDMCGTFRFSMKFGVQLEVGGELAMSLYPSAKLAALRPHLT